MRNSRRTEFKKGNKPKNHLPVGSERVAKDSIIQIKIAEPNKWQSKHSLIYEREHGPIPKGHVIIFGDGDKRNFDPANLVCVSRSELVRLNKQRYSRQHPELKPALISLVKIEVRARELSKGPAEREERILRLRVATKKAKATLKTGDRIRVSKCPGTKRWIIFDHFEGNEIISKSGRGEYAASSIDRLNGASVDFCA